MLVKISNTLFNPKYTLKIINRETLNWHDAGTFGTIRVKAWEVCVYLVGDDEPLVFVTSDEDEARKVYLELIENINFNLAPLDCT